jgi:hypothetical protein
MNSQRRFPVLNTQHGTERRRSPRYRFSEAVAVQCPGGPLMTGISVEISQGGMSAMVNGLLQVGDAAEIYPVAGGPFRPECATNSGYFMVSNSPKSARCSSGKLRRIGRNRMRGACARNS